MPKNGLNVALKGLDDLFSSEETRQEEQREQVQQIPVSELFPFKNHPFKVLDDDAMTRTVESISQFGVLAPLIARPRPEGGYEIISGHRRKHAAELAHLDTVPVIVRNMEDDAATILMVDSNLVPELLDMVDEKKISFNPAVELSYLDEAQQRDFLEAMNDTQNAPSLSQAQQLKKMAQQGEFSYEAAFDVMGKEKKSELDTVTIKNETLRKYFPRSYTPRQMEDIIIKLLDQWQRKRQRSNER